MPILSFQGETFSCERAQKGSDFVRLLDANNNIVFFAEGISDFAPYVLSDGDWEAPLAVVAPTVGAYAETDGDKIVLTIPGSVKAETGLQVNFKAPCDCSAVSAVRICGVDYTVVDYMGQCVTGDGGSWVAGSQVSVVLDVVTRNAYVQFLSGVGKYKQHWWKRTSDTSVAKYKPVLEAISSSITLYSDEEDDIEFNYSKTLNCTAEGASLANPVAGYIGTIVKSAPCYFEDYGTLYYVPAGATYRNDGWDNEYDPEDCPDDFLRTMDMVDEDDDGENDYEVYAVYITRNTDVKKVTGTESYVENAEDPTVEYLNSPDRSAFPNGETVDGWIYEYLGVPLDNAITATRIARGAYSGTGTYGSKNPTTLTFDFKPEVILFDTGTLCTPLFWGTTSYHWYRSSLSSSASISVNYDGNTISWYNKNSAADQMNVSGGKYQYIAIG